jgi:hypothetical protein
MQTGQEYTRRLTDLVGDHGALLQLEIKRRTDQLLRHLKQLRSPRRRAIACLYQHHGGEHRRAVVRRPGNTSSEGAGDGAWLCPRRAFQPDA